MADEQLIFRVHAIQRMFERKVSESDIRAILNDGKVIEEYPDDEPFPSRLILGNVAKRSLHVVAADNKDQNETIIITVYEPDSDRWEPGYKVRRKK